MAHIIIDVEWGATAAELRKEGIALEARTIENVTLSIYNYRTDSVEEYTPPFRVLEVIE